MPKANFSKVEQALEAGLLKMSIEELHHLVKKNASQEEQKQLQKILSLKKKHQALITLSLDLKALSLKDATIYSRLKISKRQMTSWLTHPEQISEEVGKQVLEWKALIEKEKAKLLDSVDNEKIIQTQRKLHVNKRFNVNEKWIPLQ